MQVRHVVLIIQCQVSAPDTIIMTDDDERKSKVLVRSSHIGNL